MRCLARDSVSTRLQRVAARECELERRDYRLVSLSLQRANFHQDERTSPCVSDPFAGTIE